MQPPHAKSFTLLHASWSTLCSGGAGGGQPGGLVHVVQRELQYNMLNNIHRSATSPSSGANKFGQADMIMMQPNLNCIMMSDEREPNVIASNIKPSLSPNGEGSPSDVDEDLQADDQEPEQPSPSHVAVELIAPPSSRVNSELMLASGEQLIDQNGMVGGSSLCGVGNSFSRSLLP